MEGIFETCREIKAGRNADYIPELADANPDGWGLAIVTVDGQVFLKDVIFPFLNSK